MVRLWSGSVACAITALFAALRRNFASLLNPLPPVHLLLASSNLPRNLLPAQARCVKADQLQSPAPAPATTAATAPAAGGRHRWLQQQLLSFAQALAQALSSGNANAAARAIADASAAGNVSSLSNAIAQAIAAGRCRGLRFGGGFAFGVPG